MQKIFFLAHPTYLGKSLYLRGNPARPKKCCGKKVTFTPALRSSYWSIFPETFPVGIASVERSFSDMKLDCVVALLMVTSRDKLI